MCRAAAVPVLPPAAGGAAAGSSPAPADRTRPPPARRPARTRKPRRRSTTGSRSAFSEKRDARPAGTAVAPRRAAQASSAATRSAISRRSSTGPASSQPIASANPAGQSGWRGSETRSGAGSSGQRRPCCMPQSSRRIAAARGFSSAGRNRPKRPALTPMAFSAARDARRQRVTLVARDQAQRLGQAVQQAAEVGLVRRRVRRPAGAAPGQARSGRRGTSAAAPAAARAARRRGTRCRAPAHAAASALAPRRSRAIGAPSQTMRMIGGQRESRIRGRFHRGDPARHLLAQGTAGGAQHQPLLVALGGRVGDEPEAADTADRMALDDDLAAAGHRGQQVLRLDTLQPAHQVRGAAIDETGWSGARAGRRTAGPRPRARGPASAGCPAPNRYARRCRTRRARRRAAASACRYRHRRGPARAIWPASQSVGSRPSRAMWPNTRAHRRVWVSSASLRKSGIWQASHSRRTIAAAVRQPADVRIARQRGQCLQVGRVVALDQAGSGRRRHQRRQQRVHMAEVEVAVAPAKLLERVEAVRLHRGGHVVGQRRALAGGAERAVAHAAAGAAGDLRDLGRQSAGAADGRRTCPARRRRRGPRPCSGPCRWRRSPPGNPPPCPGTAPPGRCGCAG